jgi:hypothetical protein
MLENLFKQVAVIWYGVLAALWTGVLLGNIILCYLGREPSWVTLFLAVGSCAVDKWIDFHVAQKIEEGYFDDKM